jgi:hypothetical protein
VHQFENQTLLTGLGSTSCVVHNHAYGETSETSSRPEPTRQTDCRPVDRRDERGAATQGLSSDGVRSQRRFEGWQRKSGQFNAGKAPRDSQVGGRETLGSSQGEIGLSPSRFRPFVNSHQKRVALTFPLWRRPFRLIKADRQPPNAECVVTVCIAAIVEGEGFIVTVSDRMLSSNDVIQAQDIAALKAMKISKGWGVMFSGNGELFYPFVNQARHEMKEIGIEHDLEVVGCVLEKLYRAMREKRFVDLHIGNLGYNTIEEFRTSGLRQLGKEIFTALIEELNKFDMGIEFIVY